MPWVRRSCKGLMPITSASVRLVFTEGRTMAVSGKGWIVLGVCLLRVVPCLMRLLQLGEMMLKKHLLFDLLVMLWLMLHVRRHLTCHLSLRVSMMRMMVLLRVGKLVMVVRCRCPWGV